MCGIYKITNMKNQKSYIGQAKCIEERWKRHKWHSKGVSEYPLYRAFKKYGIENFSFDVLEECSPGQLDEREIFYIQKYDAFKNGYNQTLGGQGTSGRSVKLSQEDIATIYDLLANSDITQREIAAKYQVGEDTISEINHGKTRIDIDITYPIRNNKRVIRYCVECGKELSITTEGTLCSVCIAKTRRVCDRPDRDELKKLIREKPFTTLAKQFGVSDNAIRKWCDIYSLPRTKREIKNYSEADWQKI